MKKTITLQVVLLLLIAVIAGACGQTSNKQEDAAGDTGKENATTSSVTEAGVFPITEEKTTLKVLMYGNSLVENFATNDFTKWLEEKTNIHIEWEVAPEKSAQEKLNITLAGGDYPDVIMGFNVKPEQMMLYGQDGVFLPLNDLIEKYGVETKKMFADISYAKESITAPDGNIYGLPQINECYHCTLSQKMWINKDWLDQLNLSMPTTTEEFYEVLKAFKENDLNGNGKPDEIPLVGRVNSGPEMFIMSSFVEKDTLDLIINDGKVDAAFNKPGWKEGLLYMNRLYEEGLIAPETYTQDLSGLNRMVTTSNAEEVIVGTTPTNYQRSEAHANYVTVPPLLGPSGLQTASINPFGILQGAYIITDNAKNPEAAFRLADLMYSEEATMRAVFGTQDKEWAVAEPGETSIAGGEAKWKRLPVEPGLQNYGWSQTGPSLRSKDFRLSEAGQPGGQETILYDETVQNYEPYKIDMDKVIPPLFFTKEQSEQLADLSKTITDYKKEFLAKAVTGNIDIEKEWDNYLKTLDSMGLDKYLQVYQDALDAKK